MMGSFLPSGGAHSRPLAANRLEWDEKPLIHPAIFS